MAKTVDFGTTYVNIHPTVYLYRFHFKKWIVFDQKVVFEGPDLVSKRCWRLAVKDEKNTNKTALLYKN